jgi:Uma2 family endonuclease
MVATRLMTVEEFEALNGDSGRYELIRGELREVPPMGMRHGEIGSIFHIRIGVFAQERRLGRVYTSDTCFILAHGQPAVIVMPDVAFVRADRLPPADQRDRYAPFPPDLAVEVRSPSQSRREIEEKIALYLEARVPMLWYCQPKPRTVTVYRPDRDPLVVGEEGELDGEDVLPDFRLRVADLFAV